MDVFECFNCSKKLRTRKGVIRHLKVCVERTRKEPTDSLIQRLSCEQCQKQFFSRAGLCKHRNKNHGPRIQKNKSIKCKYCSATFASKQGRLDHSKKNHPEYNLKRDELISRRLHSCIFCGKSFTRKSYRSQHEEICLKKSSVAASSSMDDVNVTAFHVQESSPDERPENSCANTITLPFQFQNAPDSLETAQFNHNVDESFHNTSYGSKNMAPKLQRYVRDRKTFLKLGSPDISTPRRSRMNLQYGQQTVKEYQKQVATLQQTVRRLQQQVKTLKDLLRHLEEQNQISATAADAFLVSVEEINFY